MRYITFFIKLLLLCEVVISERLHGQIYSSIEGSAACFRRLNATHQTGCTSTESGAVGPVQMIREVSDAQWLVYNGTAGPYMAVVSTVLFHHVIDLLLEQPANVAGILLYDNATMRPDAFTQESRCPNEYSAGPGSSCSSSKAGGIVWNDKGSGLLQRDIPYPIFYLPQSRAEELVKIEQCYERYNIDKDNQVGKPLCSIQLNSFMFAVISTEVCLRRSSMSALLDPSKVCDPLGDYNVYYSLFPRVVEKKKGRSSNANKQVILVTARMDAASLFDGVAPGAASAVVGMSTLIMAAVTLSQMIPDTDAHLYNKSVLWTLFNGETFDYIGSQRVAYDIKHNAWPPASPVSPEHISLHVEVGQLGGSLLTYKHTADWPLYAFGPYSSVIPPAVTEFLAEMTSNINLQKMSLMPEFTANLPPSSLHSFRRILGNETLSGKLPEVLLVDHQETFNNLFYESVLDDYDNIGFVYHNISFGDNGTFLSTDWLVANGTMSEGEPQVKVARLASALARTLYQQVTGVPYDGNVSASAHLADEMLHCLLQSQACPLLAAAEFASSAAGAAGARSAPLYVGVSAWAGAPAACAAHLLALLAGRPLPADRAQCDALNRPGYNHYYLKGWNHTGICIQSTVNLSQAVSPAFIIEGYNMTSGDYSTWTESVWHTMWARVFVASGGVGARVAAIAGALVTILASALTYWLQKHSDIVFMSSTAAVVNDQATGILRTVNC